MKKIIIMCVVALLSQNALQAQGIIYMSNLGQTTTGSESVGNNSWLAENFTTGTNASGYTLNWIQLALADATGNPSNFTAMVYSAIFGGGVFPGSSLETLNGSANPSTSGIYTYSDVSNLMLSPNTDYFIVLTAGTAVANGAYEWSLAGKGNYSSYNPSGGWVGGGAVVYSSNGSSWSFISGVYPQFSIDATPVPEPSLSFLLLLGGGVFIYVRRAFRH